MNTAPSEGANPSSTLGLPATYVGRFAFADHIGWYVESRLICSPNDSLPMSQQGLITYDTVLPLDGLSHIEITR